MRMRVITLVLLAAFAGWSNLATAIGPEAEDPLTDPSPPPPPPLPNPEDFCWALYNSQPYPWPSVFDPSICDPWGPPP